MDLLRERPEDEAQTDELIARVEAGEPVGDGDRRGLPLAGRLRLQAVERDALELMTPQERVDAFWKGRLSSYQQHHWHSAFGDEVPTIDDVPVFLAATLVDVCESRTLSREAAAVIRRYRAAYPASPWS